MKDIDTNKIADIIRHVSATEVLPRFNTLQKSEIREKGPGDLVTVADEASEKLFTKLLHDALPGSLVVGEEAVSKDPSVLNKFREDNPVWIIDPIDGTYNFAHGNPKFGILISLVQGGVTRYGWAFDVVGNRMAIAQKGAGATLDGKRLKIACEATELKQLRGRFSSVQPSAAAFFREFVYLRCSLHDFMDFLTGQADFVSYGHKVTPWDHAAACLLAEEAGGYVATSAVDVPYDPTYYGLSPLLVAPNKEWWLKLAPVLYSESHKIASKA